jgi:DNA-binding LacI/PurR family transcriptional regulator
MDLKEFRKKLPCGAIKDIAERTNTSTATVCNVMSGKKESPLKHKILQAAAEYLTEYKAKEREVMQALQEAATA